jgi:predicted NBD/HSP70 family sugar kinase
MTIYAGLDVSDKTVHVCVVDDAGVVLQRDVVATDPEVLILGTLRNCVVWIIAHFVFNVIVLWRYNSPKC